MFNNMRQKGTCIGCDEPVFEVVRRYPDTHPWAGAVMEVGDPLPYAQRACLPLMNGKMWNITVCDTCLETGMLDKNLPALWEKNIAALRWEMDDQNRVTMGVRELSDKGRKAVADSILELVDSPPLGVLGVESWEAIMERERG